MLRGENGLNHIVSLTVGSEAQMGLTQGPSGCLVQVEKHLFHPLSLKESSLMSLFKVFVWVNEESNLKTLKVCASSSLFLLGKKLWMTISQFKDGKSGEIRRKTDRLWISARLKFNHFNFRP